MSTMRCRHCGRNFTNGLAHHAQHCIVQQRAAYIVALDRGDGCIVPESEWRGIAQVTSLFQRDALLRAIGGDEWADVALHFDLGLKPRQRRGREMVDDDPALRLSSLHGGYARHEDEPIELPKCREYVVPGSRRIVQQDDDCVIVRWEVATVLR